MQLVRIPTFGVLRGLWVHWFLCSIVDSCRWVFNFEKRIIFGAMMMRTMMNSHRDIVFFGRLSSRHHFWMITKWRVESFMWLILKRVCSGSVSHSRFDAMIFDRWCRVVGRQYVSDSEVKLLNNLTSRADKISRQFRTEILFRRKKRRRHRKNTGKHHRSSVDDDDDDEEEGELSPKRRRSSPLTLSAHSALLLREFGIAQHHMHNHDKLSGVVEDLDAILRDRSELLSPTSPKSPKSPKSPEKKVKKKKRRTSFTTVYELLQHRRRSSTSSSQSNKSDERAAKAMWRWSQTHLKRHQDFKKTNERHLHASRRTRRAARSAASVSLVASQDAAYAVERSRLSIVALTCAHASESRCMHLVLLITPVVHVLWNMTWGISRRETRASAKAAVSLKASINARVKSGGGGNYMYVVSHHPFISAKPLNQPTNHRYENESRTNRHENMDRESPVSREKSTCYVRVQWKHQSREENVEINSSLEWCRYHIKFDKISPGKCGSEDSESISWISRSTVYWIESQGSKTSNLG